MAKKNWIAGAIKHPGALTKKAKAAGQSPMGFAAAHKNDPGTTGKQARLAITLRGFSHLPKGVSQSPEGDLAAANNAEAHALGTFKGVQDMNKGRMGWKGMTDSTTYESFKGPYGKLRMDGGAHNDSVGSPGAGSNEPTVPKKSTQFITEKLPKTGVPQGLYHPVRGEGPPAVGSN